jgi:hypothetical protein
MRTCEHEEGRSLSLSSLTTILLDVSTELPEDFVRAANDLQVS